MPHKAFLKKKSLLDRFKDDYATHTGYIQSARAEHTWNNPLTRRKRTKELNKWIKSFAGKDHIHKLARFNATNAGRYESMYNEAMSLKGFLENLTEKLTKQFNFDAEKVQAYLDSHTQEMQELLDDKDLSLKEKVLFVRSEITGEKDEAKKDNMTYVLSCKIGPNDTTYCKNKYGAWTDHIEDAWEGSGPDSFTDAMKQNFADSIGAEIADLEIISFEKFESKQSESFVLPNPTIIYKGPIEDAKKACNYVSKILADKGLGWGRVSWQAPKDGEYHYGHPEKDVYTVTLRGSNDLIKDSFAVYKDVFGNDFWNNCDADPQGWVDPQTIARYDVATPRQESNETDEKLGYEKGHKNSRGEDAPWVIRSHEDNRVLASFANKKDAEEHMKRMKQYSKSESKQNEGLSNEKVKDAVKFAATEAGLENYLNVDSDGAMSVTVSLPINSDYLKTVRWVIDSNDGTITEYLDTEKNLIRDFTDDESLVSMLTLLFQTSRMELRDWLPKKSESVNMDGFKNMLCTYNEKGGSVKNGPWRICDGAYDLWFELYYNETPILGCTDNICTWYSNPETVSMTFEDYKKIEDAISSEIFAIDSFKMPESKKSEDPSKDEKMGENREDWVPCILVARNPIANNTDYCYNLDGDWTPHEDNAYIFKSMRSAEQTAQKFVDKLQRGHVNGFAAWTTKNISIEPLKDSGSKSEELETYACFIDFETEDEAKQGLEIVKGWNPVRDDTAVVVDGLGEDAANRLWNDWKQKCAKAGLAISDAGEVYKEEPACFYGNESKKSEALLNKTEMENIAIKAAVKAAWSAAKVKYFRIDFRNTHPGELNVYPVTSDGKDVGPFWGVSPDKGIVYQYNPAWDDSGKDEVVREMKFKDIDGIEEIFTGEFIAMDDTLEVSIENGGDNITFIDSSNAKDESKKSEDSDNSGESKAWCVTVEYKSGDGETEKIDVVTQRHDTEEQARQAGIAYVKDRYTPANDINVISAKRLPKWAARNIQNLVKNKNKSEDTNDVTYELTEDAVTGLIKELGLEIVNTWYDGNKDRIVYDCKDKGDENGETVCVWVEPPYEARVWLKDVNPRVNQLVEGIETLDALKSTLVDIFKIELGESHVTESLRKPEDTIIVPNWLWETYTLGENYDGDTLTDDEQQTYLDFKEKYEGFNLKAVSENTTFRSDNDFDSNGCPCYEVNVFKK